MPVSVLVEWLYLLVLLALALSSGIVIYLMGLRILLINIRNVHAHWVFVNYGCCRRLVAWHHLAHVQLIVWYFSWNA